MDAVRHSKRSHTLRPRCHHDNQYYGGRGGEDEVVSSLWPPGGAAQYGVGGGQAQPVILRRQKEDRWEGPHLGSRRRDGFNSNVPTDGTRDKPGEV